MAIRHKGCPGNAIGQVLKTSLDSLFHSLLLPAFPTPLGGEAVYQLVRIHCGQVPNSPLSTLRITALLVASPFSSRVITPVTPSKFSVAARASRMAWGSALPPAQWHRGSPCRRQSRGRQRRWAPAELIGKPGQIPGCVGYSSFRAVVGAEGNPFHCLTAHFDKFRRLQVSPPRKGWFIPSSRPAGS